MGGNGTVWAVLSPLMGLGYAMVLVGFGRARHAGSLVALLGGSWLLTTVLFWAVGGALLNGSSWSGWIGREGFFRWGGGNPWPELVGVSWAVAIVIGGTMERVRFGPMVLILGLLGGVVFPGIGHAFGPHGWAARLGAVDPAGAVSIHLAGGTAAWVATALVGPRYGRFSAEGLPNVLPAHNLPLSYLGAFLLLPGWVAWTLARGMADPERIVQDGLLAVAAAGLTAMLVAWVRFGKPDIPLTINGIVAGVAAVSAGVGTMPDLAVLVVGGGAGWLVVTGTGWMDRLRWDDPGGVVAAHGLTGLWGAVAVALFHAERGLLLGGGATLLGAQLLGSLVVFLLVGGITAGVMTLFCRWGRLRATAEEQLLGLDTVDHGNEAYADFQRVEFK